ncbi:MAG: PD-(D/E)XK nuclease family protein [Lentisphaeria bacterium]|jgi:putative RecB family exonuclease|nr:PD-(D/E)XK nuclease family protein [Lentisphaeria bacterium]
MKATASLAELRRAPHWSNSQINALANFCSLAWAFRYVHRLEPEFVPVSLVFGTAFHSALSYHAARRLQGKACTIGECADLLETLLADGCKSDSPPVRMGEGESVGGLVDQGIGMLRILLGSADPEEEVEAVGLPFSVPLFDANGVRLDKPLIGEFDLVVRRGGIRTIVDWKTSARRWPEGKAESDLQATCYLWAERQTGHPDSRFRFEVVTKTKSPVCERHPATRDMDDFVRLGELVRVLERVVANECFHPQEGGWECNGCPYTTACTSWHRERARTFVRLAA